MDTIMDTLHIDKYYTTYECMLDAFDSCARKLAYNASNIDEYNEWKKKLRDELNNITGISKMKKCELMPQVLENRQMDGYVRKKVIIQTENKVWMPFYILVPDDLKEGEKRPSIIAAHGHGCGGKFAPAGVTEIPVIQRNVEHENSDYGLQLAKKGFIVFCPDARGSGERRERREQGDDKNKFIGSSCNDLNFAAISMGRSLTGMWVWDLMRLIDFISTLDYCDTDRIGCCGFSGGGLQSIWLAAMDDRIKCAVVSGYFHGYRDSVMRTNRCGCNFVPHLWETADMGDLGALVAPRPLLIESGDRDSLNGPRGITDVKEQYEITLEAYKLHGAADKLEHHVYEGGHKWYGVHAVPFFKKWL